MRATRGSVSSSVRASPFSQAPPSPSRTVKKTNYTLFIMGWLAAIVYFFHNIWMQTVMYDYRHRH
jgi:hypothetical protein